MDTDIIHEFGGHAEWNESFYFNFYDRTKDICGFMRIGLKPNKNEKSMFCFFFMPDGSIYGFRGAQPCADSELSVGGLAFVKLAPEKHWRLSFNGMLAKMTNPPVPVNASFSLDFEALNEMFDYRSCVNDKKAEMSKSVVSEHLEQYGGIKGTLKLGGKEYSINGLGERDHSWGIREWTAPKMWIWLTCQFSDTEALNVTKLAVEQGEVDAGFLHLDGENIPLDEITIDTQYSPEGGPKSFSMDVKDPGGKHYKVEAEIIKQALLPFESPEGRSVMYETLARYRFNGKTGYGIAEYLIKKV